MRYVNLDFIHLDFIYVTCKLGDKSEKMQLFGISLKNLLVNFRNKVTARSFRMRTSSEKNPSHQVGGDIAAYSATVYCDLPLQVNTE